MIYIDCTILKINIAVRQSAELGNTKPRSKQNDKLVIILVIDLIDFNKGKQAFFLHGRKMNFRFGVIFNDRVDMKVKRIFPDTVIQVSMTIMNSIDTENREYRPLESIKDNYPKYLLTRNDLIQHRNGIKHYNIAPFMKENRMF